MRKVRSSFNTISRIGKWQLSFGSEMSGLTQYLMESIMGDFKARYNNFHSSIFNNLFLLCIERRSNYSHIVLSDLLTDITNMCNALHMEVPRNVPHEIAIVALHCSCSCSEVAYRFLEIGLGMSNCVCFGAFAWLLNLRP